jgi:hypothetical protein
MTRKHARGLRFGMTDFASADLKLWRARQHLTEFQMVLSTYLKTNPVTLVAQPQTDPLRESFDIGLAAPLPDLLGLIYGDFIHNVRTCLDHLAMALAVRSGANPRDNTVQFPICDHPNRYFGNPDHETQVRPGSPPRSTGGNMVRALGPSERAFIEGLQPYHGQGDSWVLSEVQNLDNMDKHRNFIVSRIFPTAFVGFDNGVEIEWASPVPDFVDGAYLATVIYPSGYDGVKVQPGFSAGIYVEGANRAMLEAESFGDHQLFPHIRGIIDEAKRLFP